MKKSIVILLLMVTSFNLLGQTSQKKEVKPLTKEQLLFTAIGSWLKLNIKQGGEEKKRFIVQPYISKGYYYMWQVEESISKFTTEEMDRNLFLDYLYDMTLLHGKNAIIQTLVEGGMPIEKSKEIIEYIQTSHKLSMEKRGKL